MLVRRLVPLTALAACVTAMNLTGIPTCGIACLAATLPKSPCLATNDTCLCLDTNYNDIVTACVKANCTVVESLTTRRITWSGCDFPLSDETATTVRMQALLFSLESVAFWTRMLSKVLGLSGWWWDDTTITLAYLSKIGFFTASFYEQQYGNGKDIWTLTSTQITNFLRLFYVFEVLYTFAIGAIKSSLLFFFTRVFPEGRCRSLLWFTQVFNIIVTLGFLLIDSLQCRPLSFFWEGWDGEHEGTCINIAAMAWAHGGINIALDLWMLALPASQIVGLRITLEKKIWVLFIFGVGIFLTISSIVRQKSIVGFTQTDNITVAFFDVALWSCIELTTGIVVACIPQAHQLRKRLLPNYGPLFFSGSKVISTPGQGIVKNSGGLSTGGRASQTLRAGSVKIGREPSDSHDDRSEINLVDFKLHQDPIVEEREARRQHPYRTDASEDFDNPGQPGIAL